jgi:hypothetical protein
LGPGASNSPSSIPYGIVVKEIVPGTLVDVVDWRQVWNDAGSGAKTDFALWQGVSPSPEYICLASFFTRSHQKPSPALTKGIKAVHISALGPAYAKFEIWTDRGSGARQDGAVWQVGTTKDVIETGAFVAVRGYGNPPAPLYGIRRDAARAITADEE